MKTYSTEIIVKIITRCRNGTKYVSNIKNNYMLYQSLDNIVNTVVTQDLPP